jgi:large subunit ribosomal protein L10
MNKQEKANQIASLREAFKDGPPIFVLAYRGLTVNQAVTLRKRVRGVASSYRVVKNRLALLGLKETPLEPLSSHFEGPTAIAYGTQEPSALAKVLDEFSKANEGLTLKAGYVDGRVITMEEIKTLAALPTREVLVAHLLGALQAPMSRLVRVLQAPARGLVQALDQIAKKKETSGAEPEPATEPPPQS